MSKGRLEAFSDGVIAIIITIMVLELKVPHGGTLAALRPVVPVLLTYALSFVFIDGGHGVDVEWADYRGWSAKIAPGGLLAIHDVFPDRADGGRPPYECYLDALDSGRFVEATGYAADSLRVLVATGAGTSKAGAAAPKSTLATPPATTSAAISTAASE